MRNKTKQSQRGPLGHFVPKRPTALKECLQENFRCTPARADELIALGAVYRKGRRVLENEVIQPGQHLTVYLQPKRFPMAAVDWGQVVVHEEAEFLVASKPAGIPVHATLDNIQDNLLSELRKRTGLPLGITQRLDLPVSGLCVFSKTDAFQAEFNRRLEGRAVTKIYRALARGTPKEGQWVHYLPPPSSPPHLRPSREPKEGWLQAELTVKVVSPWGEGYTDVEVGLLTGRMHQIRAQLACEGHPLLGDRRYGDVGKYPLQTPTLKAIGLHSYRLGWENPQGQGREFCVEPPWIDAKR